MPAEQNFRLPLRYEKSPWHEEKLISNCAASPIRYQKNSLDDARSMINGYSHFKYRSHRNYTCTAGWLQLVLSSILPIYSHAEAFYWCTHGRRPSNHVAPYSWPAGSPKWKVIELDGPVVFWPRGAAYTQLFGNPFHFSCPVRPTRISVVVPGGEGSEHVHTTLLGWQSQVFFLFFHCWKQFST